MLAIAGLVAFGTAQTRDDGALFEEVAARVGLTFTYENGAVGQFYVPEVMGAGAALIDYDNDGDLDVYLLQGQSLDPKAPRDAARTHRLFRNELVEREDAALHGRDRRAAASEARPTPWAWPPAITTTTAIRICTSRRSGRTRCTGTMATARSPT